MESRAALGATSYGARNMENAIDGADLFQKKFKGKKKLLKAIDAHPIVCNRSTIPHYVPWTV